MTSTTVSINGKFAWNVVGIEEGSTLKGTTTKVGKENANESRYKMLNILFLKTIASNLQSTEFVGKNNMKHTHAVQITRNNINIIVCKLCANVQKQSPC
ncbi:hypothetical protein M8J76_016865 [Diaphorina citri]|nr:hypothetical protein M8J76_016865 [Diaphorina citri]KAI5753346.1 hypothetical protein M8J77_026090 [Diaphorina citri]